jgi:tRNA threonylcarbamoyl adenosine modification protein YeaZ
VRTLYIDLGLADGGFTLAQDDRVVGGVRVADHKEEAGLMPALERLLKDAGWTTRDLGRIAAVTGPGGFMTIRVAISMANAMAYALKIPIAGVHASDVWAAAVQEKDWVWLHSTKKTHAFARGFGSHANIWPEAGPHLIDDLAKQLPKGTLWAGELIPEHLAALPQLKHIETAKQTAAFLPALLQGLSYGDQTLLPWYGRGA